MELFLKVYPQTLVKIETKFMNFSKNKYKIFFYIYWEFSNFLNFFKIFRNKNDVFFEIFRFELTILMLVLQFYCDFIELVRVICAITAHDDHIFRHVLTMLFIYNNIQAP